jgi:hypothetical protein
MRCSITASFRASATFAFVIPARRASFIAQLLSPDPLIGRVSMTFAASYSAVRTLASPILVIRPLTSVSPDWYFLGVSPKWGPTRLDDENREGSSIAALSQGHDGADTRRRHE